MNFSESFSARAAMTFPREEREVLMNLASSSLTSTELDFLTLSEPARSMSERVEDMYSVLEIFCVTYIVKIVWLRLDSSFIFYLVERVPGCRPCGI